MESAAMDIYRGLLSIFVYNISPPITFRFLFAYYSRLYLPSSRHSCSIWRAVYLRAPYVYDSSFMPRTYRLYRKDLRPIFSVLIYVISDDLARLIAL